MILASTYHRASGTIVGHIQAPAGSDLTAYSDATYGLAPGWLDAETEYVIDGSPPTVGARMAVTPTITPAAPVEGDTVTVTGLPDPCWVNVNGEFRQVVGGVVTRTVEAGDVFVSLSGPYSGIIRLKVMTADEAELTADGRWAAIQSATPAQIGTWLDNNVTNLAEARAVLKVLILAARKALAPGG